MRSAKPPVPNATLGLAVASDRITDELPALKSSYRAQAPVLASQLAREDGTAPVVKEIARLPG